MRITEHFSLSEFVESDTARRRKIDNNPSASVILKLIHLCTNVLEPLRVKFGAPITVTSGYRCPELNKAVGGAADSQHMRGEAADIKAKSPSDTMRLFHLIRESGYFDQVICEEYDPHTNTCAWVHVSVKMDGVNRQRALIKYRGRRGYYNWN